MKKFRLLAGIILAVAVFATGITGVSAATMVTNRQLDDVKNAVDSQGDVQGVFQGLMLSFARSLMEQDYKPDEFQAAMATIMDELLSAIPEDAENYASLVEQAFSGAIQGVATGVADAAGTNSNLDQATYETSARNGLVSAAQEVSGNDPDLDLSTLMAAIGAGGVEEPEAYESPEQASPGTAIVPPANLSTSTVVEIPPTQDDTAASPI